VERAGGKWATGAALSLVALVAAGCVGVGIDDYREFRGAVKSGATCEQLFDIAANFDDRPATRARIDDDLRDIGCTDAGAERRDR
jgi:hypothetical protein